MLSERNNHKKSSIDINQNCSYINTDNLIYNKLIQIYKKLKHKWLSRYNPNLDNLRKKSFEIIGFKVFKRMANRDYYFVCFKSYTDNRVSF